VLHEVRSLKYRNTGVLGVTSTTERFDSLGVLRFASPLCPRKSTILPLAHGLVSHTTGLCNGLKSKYFDRLGQHVK